MYLFLQHLQSLEIKILEELAWKAVSLVIYLLCTKSAHYLHQVILINLFAELFFAINTLNYKFKYKFL